MEIVVEDKRSAALVPSEPAQPSSLMTVIERLAINPNVDIEKLRQLLEMQERWEMRVLKAEFDEAMAEFKKNPPEIIKSRIAEMSGVAKGSGKEYSIKVNYSDLDDVTSAIVGDLAEKGITHRFIPKQDGDRITVSCVLRRKGYTDEPATMTAGPDTSGAKNAIQAIASTFSYLERYTLLAACGLSCGMPDTDGNLNGVDAKEERLKAIRTAPDIESLKKVYLASSKAATESKDARALEEFTVAKETRKKELANA